MEQHVHYCTTADGANLAYATIGDGRPLVKVANWLSHLDADWRSPVWRHWLEALSSHHQLIRYDERGCGLSDWEIDDITFEAWVQDLEAVVDATGVDRFPLLGVSAGGAIAIAYAVRHPERVSHLILYGSYARGMLHRDPSKQNREDAQTMVNLVKMGWGQENPAFRQVFTTQFLPEGTPEQWSWFNELQRLSTSTENAARIISRFQRVNVQALAPKVEAQTLVIHAKGDVVVPFEEGRLLASLIPKAKFVSVDSKNHILLQEEPAWGHFLAEVRAFLGVADNSAGELSASKEEAVFGRFKSATLLFADLVGFTKLSTELEAEESVALLDDVFSYFDRIVEKYDLEKIRVVGDEYMAASGAPRPRPDHALAMANAVLEMAAYVDQLPIYAGEKIQFRFGLNSGPVTTAMIGRSKLQYDIWGDAVNIASRMESQGRPGKIQISADLYQLLSDEFICERRGLIDVKGKGQMETWWLTGRKPRSTSDSAKG
jgi:class 3 adenylate cyclase